MSTTGKDKQVWFCETCQQVGYAELEPHTDVYSAMRAIKRSHKALSPTCTVPVERMRVINTAIITSKEALVAGVPEWVVDPASQFLGFESQGEKEVSLASTDRLERELRSILQPLGVESEGSLQPREHHPEPTRPLVVSLYDAQDTALWNSLQSHFNLLIRHSAYLDWHTYKIRNNALVRESQKEITADISRASMILLGLSIDFLTTLHEEGNYILTALKTACEQKTTWCDHIQPILLSP